MPTSSKYDTGEAVVAYNKLVRDRIPEIITKTGKRPEVRTMEEGEYKKALRDKLQEEIQEYIDEPSIEELADILEVIYALAATHQTTQEVLEEVRAQKAQERGGFTKRVFLERVFS